MPGLSFVSARARERECISTHWGDARGPRGQKREALPTHAHYKMGSSLFEGARAVAAVVPIQGGAFTLYCVSSNGRKSREQSPPADCCCSIVREALLSAFPMTFLSVLRRRFDYGAYGVHRLAFYFYARYACCTAFSGALFLLGNY